MQMSRIRCSWLNSKSKFRHVSNVLWKDNKVSTIRSFMHALSRAYAELAYLAPKVHGTDYNSSCTSLLRSTSACCRNSVERSAVNGPLNFVNTYLLSPHSDC